MESKDLAGIRQAFLSMDSLCIFRGLLEDPVLRRFYLLLKSVCLEADREVSGSIPANGSDAQVCSSRLISLYGDFFYFLAQHTPSLSLFDHIIALLLRDENPFSRHASSPRNPSAGSALTAGSALAAGSVLAAATASDLGALQKVASINYSQLQSCLLCRPDAREEARTVIERLPGWESPAEEKNDTGMLACKPETEDSVFSAESLRRAFLSASDWSSLIGLLEEYYRRNGYGPFSGVYAFLWQSRDGKGELLPVETPDPVRLSDLIAYECEREEVIRNTEQFLQGHPANNVLLYGDRGTGKSSTVKALLNEYRDRGLRMVEVPKKNLADFPLITAKLADKPFRFIVFVDDLAFEDNEENYTALKAALEGGLQVKPANVLLYATSNRRHLIKEKFSDRAGLQYGSSEDEVRASDSIQEKLSLSDRFGITVVFSSPDKKRYLKIVEELARQRGLDIDFETLSREAMKWELWYNGRSPRTAQQFITWLEQSNPAQEPVGNRKGDTSDVHR